MDRILVGLSGGRTSAYMARKLVDKYGVENVICLFCNTSAEHLATYDFVRNIEKLWGFNVCYLEVDVHHDKRKGCTHKVVKFEDLKRNNELFEEVIKKYGIANKVYMHCTRELKTNVVKSFVRDNKLNNLSYAIGIRSDEIDRMKFEKGRNLIYPLVSEFPTTKRDVLDFWKKQDFDLELPEHYGNCVACFKKSARKMLTIAKNNPREYDFMNRMEMRYGSLKGKKRLVLTQSRFNKWLADGENMTIRKMVRLAQEIDFEEFSDPYFDQHDGCSETCEAF